MLKDKIKLLQCIFSVVLFIISDSLIIAQTNDTIDYTKNYKVYMVKYDEYPNEAEINEIEGKITAQFDIDAKCNFNKILLLDTLGFGCDIFVLDKIQEIELEIKKDNKNQCVSQYKLTIPFYFKLAD